MNVIENQERFRSREMILISSSSSITCGTVALSEKSSSTISTTLIPTLASNDTDSDQRNNNDIIDAIDEESKVSN